MFLKKIIFSISYFKKLKEKISSLERKIYDLQHQLNNSYFLIENSFYKSIPEELYPQFISKWYENNMNCTLNLKNPSTFNEKIQYTKIWQNSPIKTFLTDKVSVRNWVSSKVGENFLIPTLGIWENPNDIDWQKLPSKFVLKTNHGSGWNYIVKDKNQVNKEEISSLLTFWLSLNYGFKIGLETQYQKIKPKILAEEFIEPEGNLGLKDFKIHCFNGEPKFITIYFVKDSLRVKKIVDLDWKEVPFYITNNPSSYSTQIEKPQNLDQMIYIARKLSEGFPYVRVDLYNENSKILFGEMTFTPNNGTYIIEPKEWELVLGSWIDLSISPKIDIENLEK